LFFKATRRHYDHVAAQLTLRGWQHEPRGSNTVLMPISGVHRAVVNALHYARSISTDVRAVYVSTDPAAADAVRTEWKEWGEGVPLVILESPYRSLMAPLVNYIEAVRASALTISSRSCCRSSCRRAGGITCCTTSVRCSSRPRSCSSRTRW
jgi:hypothetical protein